MYADQIPRLSGMLVGEMPSNGKFGPSTYANPGYGMQGVYSPYDSVG